MNNRWLLAKVPCDGKWSVRRDGRELYLLDKYICRADAQDIETMLNRLERDGELGGPK